MSFKIKDGVRIGTVDVFNNSGTLLVNAPTATKWETARTITLGGDLSGSVSLDGTNNVTLTATIAADSVALGTDTTGNYVASVSGSGSGISVSGSGEGASVTISHGATGVLSAGIQGSSGIASLTVDSFGHVTGVTTATYLTSESDTLQTVTDRGASSNVATITLNANTTSTNTTSGTLVVTGGVGIGGALNVGGTLTIGGNLIVNGTTTTVNSTTTTLDDPIITLGGDTAPTSDDNKDRGVEFRWHNGSLAKLGFFGYDDSTGKFTFIPDATNSGEIFSGTTGELDAKVDYSNILNQPTIGSGTLTLSIGSAATTNNTVTIAVGTGFTANSTSNQTYSLSVGPALTNLASTMTGSGSGFLKKTAQDTFTVDTNTYLTSESDTLATVTGRGATTTNSITVPSLTLAVSGTATADLAPVSAAISTTSATAVDSWAIATYRSARYTVQITQGTNYQVSEILVIHNGTTTYMTEYAVQETGGALGTFTTDVSGGNVRLLVTMGSAASATVKLIRHLLVV